MAAGRISIDQALRDRNLLGAALGDLRTWVRWLVVLRAAFGLGIAMSEDERAAFAEIAGGRAPPTRRVAELWAVVGRRSGKTRMAAAVAVFIAAIERHKLAPGEVGYVLLLAASKDQAKVAFQYVTAFLQRSPVLRQQIESITANEVRLKGDIIIGVHAGSYRTIRGRSLLAVVGDETAFWRDESSAQPDLEIFRACAPALAATGGIWIGISTGYRKIGLLYQRWRDHFGQDSSDILVVSGNSLSFNPSLSAEDVERAKAADPEAAGSEWDGEFRSDIAAFLDDATIDAAIDFSRPVELPPRAALRYGAFVDPSGGRHDHFTLCIGHEQQDGDDEVWNCDVIRGRAPPFDPSTVVAEYAKLLGEYGIKQVTGDNYSGEWAASAFESEGIKYIRSELAKSSALPRKPPAFHARCRSPPESLAPNPRTSPSRTPHVAGRQRHYRPRSQRQR